MKCSVRAAILAAIMIFPPSGFAAVVLNGPTTDWSPVFSSNIHDAPGDSQSGAAGLDIVGDEFHPSLYTRFYDGDTPGDPADDEIAFRIRKNALGSGQAYFIGLDVDDEGVGNPNDLDFFISYSGKNPKGAAVWSAGPSANISPNDTTVTNDVYFPNFTMSEDPVNAVTDPLATDYDLDGNAQADAFLSFAIPFAAFQDLVFTKTGGAVTLTPDSLIRYALASLTQSNSFNGDISGYNDKVDDMNVPYDDQGALSDPLSLSNIFPTIISDGGGDTAAVQVVGGTTFVTTVVAVDNNPGDTVIYSLTGGADQALFTIDAFSGVLSFTAAPTWVNGGNNDYVVAATACDDFAPPGCDTQTITVTVVDPAVDAPPIITSNGGLDSVTIRVRSGNATVADVNAIDPNGDAITFAIQGGADASLFTIDPITGLLSFITAPDFDAPADVDANNRYLVVVEAVANGLSDSQTITVVVVPVIVCSTTSKSGGPCFVGALEEGGGGLPSSGLLIAVAAGVLCVGAMIGRDKGLLCMLLLALLASSAPSRAATGGGFDITDVDLKAFVGGGLMLDGEVDGACTDGCTSTFEAENELHLGARASWWLLESLTLEAGLKYEFYSWDLDGALGRSGTHLNAWTVNLGSTWYFEPLDLWQLRPLAGGALGYKILDDKLDFPVTGYDNALGLEVYGGVAKGPFELRLGLTRYHHGKDSKSPDYAGASPGKLKLDALFLELSYNFGFDAPEAVRPAAEPMPAATTPDNGDDDGDGVVNGADACPATPKGARVDARGCTAGLDSDKDGLTDDAERKLGTDPLKYDTDGGGLADGLEVNETRTNPLDPADDKVDEIKRMDLMVNFHVNSAEIDDKYANQIEVVADFMKKHDEVNATIEGYTDSDGTEEYNLRLSEERAAAIRQVLIERFSIAPERITLIGHGESKNIAPNDTEEGKARNRRVEVIFK